MFPWKRFQVRTSRRSTVLPMRVVIADPPAFTPAYDHELAAALARQGVDVELVTSRFRFGEHAGAGRLPAQRALLPVVLANLPAVAAAPAAEGRGAPAGHGGVCCVAGPTSCTCSGWRRPSSIVRSSAPARAARVHRARPACRGARRAKQRALANAARPVRPRRRPQRARPARALAELGVDAARDPASCLSERSAARRRRTHAARASARSVPTRVSATRSRRRSRSTARVCSSPATRSSR